MRRRLEPEIRLETPDVPMLTRIVEGAAKSRGFTIDTDAATAVAERSLYPWQAHLLFGEARRVATKSQQKRIQLADATRAFQIIQIDANGLLREDRDVIKALLKCPNKSASQPNDIRYRMGEEALCAAVGIDRATYKRRVQPKLLRLGLLTTTGGQCLQEKAVQNYEWLLRGDVVPPSTT